MKNIIDAANIIQTLIDDKEKMIEDLWEEIHQLRATKRTILTEGQQEYMSQKKSKEIQ